MSGILAGVSAQTSVARRLRRFKQPTHRVLSFRACLENVAAEVRRRIKLDQIIRLLTLAATRFGISKHALTCSRWDGAELEATCKVTCKVAIRFHDQRFSSNSDWA
jgi:hypothetical protein